MIFACGLISSGILRDFDVVVLFKKGVLKLSMTTCFGVFFVDSNGLETSFLQCFINIIRCVLPLLGWGSGATHCCWAAAWLSESGLLQQSLAPRHPVARQPLCPGK